jgi:hypothetical protein
MSPAKAVPVSMADGEFAEPLLEHSMSGQGQRERKGGGILEPRTLIYRPACCLTK